MSRQSCLLWISMLKSRLASRYVHFFTPNCNILTILVLSHSIYFVQLWTVSSCHRSCLFRIAPSPDNVLFFNQPTSADGSEAHWAVEWCQVDGCCSAPQRRWRTSARYSTMHRRLCYIRRRRCTFPRSASWHQSAKRRSRGYLRSAIVKPSCVLDQALTIIFQAFVWPRKLKFTNKH